MRGIAFIDPRLPDELSDNLKKLSLLPIKVPLSERVDSPIAGHPDIQLFIHKDKCFVHPEICPEFLRQIENRLDIIICNSSLGKKYPLDISYNIACTGNKAFHRIDKTDEKISTYFDENEIKLINVKQGYSKCSVLIVNETSIITADKSIHNKAMENEIDSLLITPGHIRLPGYNHGFIGGVSGVFYKSVLLTGKIDHHPDRDWIENFIISKGKEIIYLTEEEAIDGGSILVCPLQF